MDLDELLKILADTNRLRILALLENRTLCVCDLEAGLAINQSNLSRHLTRLRKSGLVRATKKGLFVYYQRLPLASPANNLVLNGLYAAMRLESCGIGLDDDRQRLESFLKTKPTNQCG